jgi:hypothetical protein
MADTRTVQVQAETRGVPDGAASFAVTRSARCCGWLPHQCCPPGSS